jgi:cytochrome b561
MSATMRASAVGPAALKQGYDPVAKAFHWLVVLLLVAQYSTELVLPYLLPKADDDALTAWHISIGPTILLVMLLRLAWRLTHPPPPPPADLPPGLRLLSRTTHWLFYAVLIVLPLLGWVAANAYGATPYLAGLIPLPALVSQDKAFAERIGGIHAALALALLALIALHVAGALFHALIKRDGVMQRMLPG